MDYGSSLEEAHTPLCASIFKIQLLGYTEKQERLQGNVVCVVYLGPRELTLVEI